MTVARHRIKKTASFIDVSDVTVLTGVNAKKKKKTDLNTVEQIHRVEIINSRQRTKNEREIHETDLLVASILS